MPVKQQADPHALDFSAWEEDCPACFTPYRRTYPSCKECGGTGLVLTREGEQVMEFAARHLPQLLRSVGLSDDISEMKDDIAQLKRAMSETGSELSQLWTAVRHAREGTEP